MNVIESTLQTLILDIMKIEDYFFNTIFFIMENYKLFFARRASPVTFPREDKFEYCGSDN